MYKTLLTPARKMSEDFGMFHVSEKAKSCLPPDGMQGRKELPLEPRGEFGEKRNNLLKLVKVGKRVNEILLLCFAIE